SQQKLERETDESLRSQKKRTSLRTRLRLGSRGPAKQASREGETLSYGNNRSTRPSQSFWDDARAQQCRSSRRRRSDSWNHWAERRRQNDRAQRDPRTHVLRRR